jgi:membrane-associated HD superfamily phosphohydrolase
MIADMVVATSRNLAGPTQEKLRALVDRAIQAVVAEGQLHECEIMLRDLEQTARSFAQSLERIYSARSDPPAAPRLRVLEPELKRA